MNGYYSTTVYIPIDFLKSLINFSKLQGEGANRIQGGGQVPPPPPPLLNETLLLIIVTLR